MTAGLFGGALGMGTFLLIPVLYAVLKIVAGVLIAFAAVNLLLILLNFAAFRSFTTEAEITAENQAVPAAEASIQTS